jgi:hypothetical protein
MRQFEFGAIVTSNVWRKYNFVTDGDAADWVNAMVAKANMVYEPQLNVHLKVGSLVIQKYHDAAAPAWDQSDQCTMTIQEQLSALASWTPPAGTAMGTWHLFDDCFVSGTIGLAYVGVLCLGQQSDGNHYNTAVTWVSGNTWHTFAHELGHNFAAGHSFELGQGSTGGIMDYGDGTLDGTYQFNSQYRKTEICNHIQTKVSTCPAFSVFTAACGNGIVETGEECECSDGTAACDGCCSCQLSLGGRQCAPGASGHGGCCTSEGLFADVGTQCALFGGSTGFCVQGECVLESVCDAYPSYFGEFCGIEGGCQIMCTGASDGACSSLGGWRDGAGNKINSLPDGVPCTTDSRRAGTCNDGTCVDNEIATISLPDGAEVTKEENVPYSTYAYVSGCVGYANRGWIGNADVAVWKEGKSVDQCNMQCLNAESCHSFTHNSVTGFCELWTMHHFVDDLAVVPGYDTFICYARAAGVDFLDADIYHGADLLEPGVLPRERSMDSGLTLSLCYKTCITDRGCHLFVFAEATGSCQLYSSEVSYSLWDLKEGYTTYILPCHGRGQICPCSPSGTSKIRMPCQCDAASSPHFNECNIGQYCYDGACHASKQRRLSADFCSATPATTTSFDGALTSTTTVYMYKVDVLDISVTSSAGTKAQMESALAAWAADKHSVGLNRVIPAAVMSLYSSGSDTSWDLSYQLLLDDTAALSGAQLWSQTHLPIATSLVSNLAETRTDLALSFRDSEVWLSAVWSVRLTNPIDEEGACFSTNANSRDEFGDGCDPYASRPSWCGQYDDSDFSSASMCCGCGGGVDHVPATAAPTPGPAPTPAPDCLDTDNGVVDAYGDGCEAYSSYPHYMCGQFDIGLFDSMTMCCVCHPFRPPTPPPTPAPPPPAPPTWDIGTGILDGAVSCRLSWLPLLVAASACALHGVVCGC